MLILENLLLNEYFPSELPDCFSTKCLLGQMSVLKEKANEYYKKSSIPLYYSGFKSETARRKFAIPNLYHYLKAADYIQSKQAEILSITDSTPHSLTSPRNRQPAKGYAFSKKSYTKKETKEIVEKMYVDNSYMIKLDIESFFDNIYTHSLAWAIHTKKVAKVNRNNSLWGNKLDTVVRAFNSDQTNGVLVGNAISRICAEIILCTIDTAIHNKFQEIKYVRFVDDYFIFVKNESQIQGIIAFIRQQLAEYELILNENKVSIIQSPFLFDSPWIGELKLFLHSAPDPLLDKSFALYNQFKDISIFKYVLKVISFQCISNKRWDCLESKLYNLWTKFPMLSELIIAILLKNKEKIHLNKLKAVLYSIIEKCISFNWQQELVWVIWAVKIFKIKINQGYVTKILKSANDLSIIILLDYIKSGAISETVKIRSAIDDKRKELETLDIDENGNHGNVLWTNHWLLAYEAEYHHWLDSSTKQFKVIENNEFYKELLNLNINFYDSNYQMDFNATKNDSDRLTKSDIEKYLELIKSAIENNDSGFIEKIEEVNSILLDKIGSDTY